MTPVRRLHGLVSALLGVNAPRMPRAGPKSVVATASHSPSAVGEERGRRKPSSISASGLSPPTTCADVEDERRMSGSWRRPSSVSRIECVQLWKAMRASPPASQSSEG